MNTAALRTPSSGRRPTWSCFRAGVNADLRLVGFLTRLDVVGGESA